MRPAIKILFDHTPPKLTQEEEFGKCDYLKSDSDSQVLSGRHYPLSSQFWVTDDVAHNYMTEVSTMDSIDPGLDIFSEVATWEAEGIGSGMQGLKIKSAQHQFCNVLVSSDESNE